MKKNTVPQIVPMEPSEGAIRDCAYQLYVESGCVPGRDLENWFEARRRLEARFTADSGRHVAPSLKTARKRAAG